MNGDHYESIGSLDSKSFTSPGQYRFTDEEPLADNYYRLKLEFENGKFVYSKIIHIASQGQGIVKVYPNPAIDFVNAEFNVPTNNLWQITLVNVANQKTMLHEQISGQQYKVRRTANMAAGVYVLKVTNQKTGETYNFKIVFSNKR